MGYHVVINIDIDVDTNIDIAKEAEREKFQAYFKQVADIKVSEFD